VAVKPGQIPSLASTASGTKLMAENP
jgi:hypothetical protein